MDRNKGLSSNRSQKKMTAHLGNEFFALGTKSSREDAKAKVPQIPKGGVSTPLERDRKREASSTISNISKKPKLSSSRAAEGDVELWEQMATDCEPVDLVKMAFGTLNQMDNEGTIRLLCGSIKNLCTSSSRTKFDIVLYLALSYMSKMQPELFSNEVVTSALVSILRRDHSVKIRHCIYSHITAANLLAKGYNSKLQLPESFLRNYVEDAINERIWVDHELCSPFVDIVCSVFQTRKPSATLTQLDCISAGTQPMQAHRDSLAGYDDEVGDNMYLQFEPHSGQQTEPPIATCLPEMRSIKFFDSDQTVEKYVIDAIKDQLNKRQQQDCYTRNLLKFLCAVSGLAEVRFLCITRLELWIHSGKLVRLAQTLLAYICFNVKSKCYKDHEVLAILIKMRLKTKPLINFYMTCLKEMITQQPEVLSIVLKLVVQNELSNTRNPNNMGMLATMFQTSPEQSAIHLADIYKEFLLQRDDCLRTLRVFLRELVRMLRFDISIIQFCKILLNSSEFNSLIEHSEFRDRIFQSMVDLTCLCMLLCVSPQIREVCMSLRVNRDVKNNAPLIKFYNQITQIQLDAVSWMYEVVPNLFKPQSTDYNQALHKILLLESSEQYSRFDQWPSEPERASLFRIVSETPIHEDSLLRIILIGITKDIPLTIPDSFDILILVIKRASTMRNQHIPGVLVNKLDVIDFLFSMAEYHHPENIKLPANYEPPKLAITVLYWKAWLIMLMVSAHNPSTFGAFCWEHYPTMKMLIEMCITNQFSEHIMSKDELQIIQVERDQILEFESYLAAQTSQAIITEENAILIAQLMLMDPMGHSRKIPSAVLEQLKYLNKTLKLGHLLCRSRKPDLLLDIIQRQGTTQSMPWLSDLVQNSEGDLNHLPVQCLCEFLLFNAKNINEDNNRDAELVNFLRNLITNPNSNKQTVCEVLDYIFRRLSSTVKCSRIAALEGLKIIFKCSESSENEWLLRCIPRMPHFTDVCGFITPQLRSACQVENSPTLIMAYIQFITAYTLNDPVTDMLDHVIDMAQLIVERSTMFQHIIPSGEDSSDEENRLQTLKCLFVMFNNYIIKLQQHHETYEWTEYPDLLMVQFADGVQLPLHLNIIHAFIILLTHSSNTISESVPILDYWFPPNHAAPIGYMPNLMQEPVQLLPDWLKLKMIRSSVDRLIDAALQDLTPDQIVLFVQNFGTPVNSMSKLLALLDHAVTEQIDAVRTAILNKAYLAQLIEIQQARGSKNGHFTVQALGLHSHSQTVPDLPKICDNVLESIDFEELEAYNAGRTLVSKEPKDVVAFVLKEPNMEYSHYQHFRKCLHQVLGHYNSNNKDSSHNEQLQNQAYDANRTVHYLLQLIKRMQDFSLYEDLPQNHHICTFLRVLLEHEVDPTEVSKLVDLLMCDPAKSYRNDEQLQMYPVQRCCWYNTLARRSAQCTLKAPYSYEFGRKRIKAMLTRSVSLAGECASGADLDMNNTLGDNGLLVDYLIELDPELSTIYHQQIQNIFSRSCSDYKFYLLSLICHQSNWKTLVYTLEYLLQFKLDLDSSIVLNFIDALMNNPKLWQGRDKCVTRRESSENCLLLNQHELKVFTEYILMEVESEINRAVDKSDFSICSRIDLLLRLTNRSSSEIVKFIDNVCNSSYSQTMKLMVLQQLYIMYPSTKFMRRIQVDKYANLQTSKGCQADRVSNYLVTCLCNLLHKKDFETLSTDTELLIRKFAASHPTLFLRQLGVLSSLIQGKAQITLRALREENHCQRFIQTLRTLELLQPMVFDDVYKQEFQNSLSCYFAFFKKFSYLKETYHILVKFVELLYAYVNVNPTTALLFLEQYVGHLMELTAKFNSLTLLQQLVQGIALLQYKNSPFGQLTSSEIKQDVDMEEQADTKPISNSDIDMIEVGANVAHIPVDVNNKGLLPLSVANPNKLSIASPHYLNLIKLVKHSNAEDVILSPLQEIECFTSKRFSFMGELFDRLLELIFSPSAQIRSNAFILLIRHLKHNPGRIDLNRCTLNAYIQCLRDDNSSVATTAIDNLLDMTLLLQEHAVEILAVAFSLGIKSRLNTSTQIKRVFQTLMLQHGY